MEKSTICRSSGRREAQLHRAPRGERRGGHDEHQVAEAFDRVFAVFGAAEVTNPQSSISVLGQVAGTAEASSSARTADRWSIGCRTRHHQFEGACVSGVSRIAPEGRRASSSSPSWDVSVTAVRQARGRGVTLYPTDAIVAVLSC